MYTASAARARFVDQALETASPSRLVTMLYDRLCLDLARAEQALRAGDKAAAHPQLLHAQDIVAALLQALDTSWEGAAGLSGIYHFLMTELMAANVANDADKAKACLDLVTPLRDAWHEAAVLSAAQAAPTAASLSFTA